MLIEYLRSIATIVVAETSDKPTNRRTVYVRDDSPVESDESCPILSSDLPNKSSHLFEVFLSDLEGFDLEWRTDKLFEFHVGFLYWLFVNDYLLDFAIAAPKMVPAAKMSAPARTFAMLFLLFGFYFFLF